MAQAYLRNHSYPRTAHEKAAVPQIAWCAGAFVAAVFMVILASPSCPL
jgi:hypothetical protein